MSIKAFDGALVGGLLLLILVLFFSEATFTGRILSPADAVFATQFFSEKTPPSFAQASNVLLFDQVYQFTPWRYVTWESIRQGRLPLWNPYSSSGTPIVATMQSAVFYPINLILDFLPFEQTFIWSALLRLWIAGISTFLLGRHYGLKRSSSLTAAISFMLSGFLVVWLGHPQSNVAIWLPGLILVGDLLILSDLKGKTLRLIALLALLVGIQFTGGHIETSTDVLLAFGIYYLLRWIQVIWPRRSSPGTKWSKLIILPSASLLLGTGLAAVQLMPFIEWLPLSAEVHLRTSPALRLLDTNFWQNLLSLPLLIFPNIYNNPTWKYPYFSFIPWGNFNENILYVGVITLVFALIALAHEWKSQPLIKIWAVIGLVTLGMAFQLPLFDWLNQFPGLSLADPKRLTLVSSFALCVLSAFGAEAVWDSSSLARLRLLRLCASLCGIVAGLGLLMALSGYIILPAIRGGLIDYGRHLVDLEYADRTTHSQPIGYYYAQVRLMADGVQAAFKIDNLPMYTSAILALLGMVFFIWAIRTSSTGSRSPQVFLLCLVTADLVSFGRGLNPSIDLANFYPSTSLGAQIARDKSLFRLTALRQDLIPDSHLMFGFSDVRGLDFPTYWYDAYMNLDPDRIAWLPYGEIFSSVDSPLLRVLNIKYVIASNINRLQGNQFLPASAVGAVYVAQLRDPQPRSFMVYLATMAQSDDQALKILGEEPDQVYRRVILSEADHPPAMIISGRDQQDSSVSQVTVADYESDRSKWNVTTPMDGYLFTSDAYYPGWTVYLDGKPAKLYRANVAFRAVYVPEGEHTVEYRYEPTSVFLGIRVSALSLAFILGLWFLGWAAPRVRHP